MSELMQGGLQVPPEQDFDTIGFAGSMQQLLSENLGNYVVIEFLIGSNSTTTQQGILYNVASQFVVLYDDFSLRYIVCDIFTIKFVYFYLSRAMPGSPSTGTDGAEQASLQDEGRFSADAPAPSGASLRMPAQAAYAFATRKTRK